MSISLNNDADIQKQVDDFEEKWNVENAWLERARVMCKSKCAHDEDAMTLHHLLLSRLFKEWLFEWRGEDVTEGEARRELANIGDGIARILIKILQSPNKKAHLKNVLVLCELFPLASPGKRPDFESYESWNDRSDFRPNLQDGLKAVILGAFFQLMERRDKFEPLPTVGELDRMVREKWKWKGDDKELRDARKELGLSGLPRGKSGRPKKQGGKK